MPNYFKVPRKEPQGSNKQIKLAQKEQQLGMSAPYDIDAIYESLFEEIIHAP